MKLPVEMRKRNAGTTLVVTLAFLVILTILVVGFVATMRTERLAASSMAANEQAKQIAQSSLAHAISLLASNIPDPGDPTVETPANSARNWFSNPGRLTIIDSSNPPVTNTVPLHSGVAASADPETAANLNAPSPTTGRYPITGSNDPMWISWKNILQDSSQPPSSTNKLVGRYAFWIDDESTKVNVNVARGKPTSMATELKLPATWGAAPPRDLLPYMANTFAAGGTSFQITHPAAVNADTVGLNGDTLQTEISGKGFLKTPDEIKAFYGSEDAYEAEKFNLTVFSRSPEFNVFGKSRIFFTKWALSTETGPAYQHTYHPEQPTTFYANTMGVSVSEGNDANNGTPHVIFRKVQEPVVASIARALQRNDWPGMGNEKFRWMNDPLGLQESDQIAVNINTMVSLAIRGAPGGKSTGATGSDICQDLTRKWGIPGDFSVPYSSEASNVWKGPLSGKGILALQAFPQINEIGVRLTPLLASGTNNWSLRVEILQEIYLPPGFFRNTSGNNMWTTPSTNGGQYESAIYAPYVRVQVVPSGTSPGINTSTDDNVAGSLEVWKGANPLKTSGPSPDGYMVLAMSRSVGNGTKFTGTTGYAIFQKSGTFSVNVRVRAGLGTNSSAYISQIAPFAIPSFQAPSGTIPSGLVATPDSDGYFEFNFTIDGTAVNAMIADPTLRPQLSYELDDPRTFYKKSAWFAMTTPNTDTLGFVNDHSTADDSKLSKFAMWDLNGGSPNAGAVGMISLVPAGTQRGISWDTLQFHSYNHGTDLPDWLILDLVAPYYGYPISQRNSTVGKINLNSRIYPDDSPVFTPPKRTKPLQALFANMPNGSQAATAIADWQTASQGFDYIGRVCDVPEVADSSHGSLDFDKEVLIRNLAGMMTTQSNVFGIWGIAQTVKKGPKSPNPGIFEKGDLVLGEKRFYAVVERYVWPGKDGTPGNAAVDGNGLYSSLAVGTDSTTSPAMPPTETQGSKVKTSDAAFQWPAIDGPQSPQLDAIHGTASYTPSSAESANNPLAALMKYRIIYFTYLD